MRPEVSVCIPAYNHDVFIKETIESCLTQDFQNIEVIVVDDSSSDRTAEIAESIADSRLRVLRGGKNRGPGGALNVAIENAKSEFVAVLASDDLMNQGRIRRQIEVLRASPNLGAVFSDVHIIDDKGNQLHGSLPELLFKTKNRGRWAWLRHFFLNGNSLAAPSVMIRREALNDTGAFNPLFLQLQDFDYWIRLCMKWEIFIIHEPLTSYRVHQDGSNTSADSATTQSACWWEYKKILSSYQDLSRAEVDNIFPDMKGLDIKGLPPDFLVAKQALSGSATPVRAFGLDVLYDLARNPANELALESLGYNWRAISRLISKSDVFGTIHFRELKEQLEERTTEAKAAYALVSKATSDFDHVKTELHKRTAELKAAQSAARKHDKEFEALRHQLEERTAEAVKAYSLLELRQAEFDAVRNDLNLRTIEAKSAYDLAQVSRASFDRLKVDLGDRTAELKMAHAEARKREIDLSEGRRRLEERTGETVQAYDLLKTRNEELKALRAQFEEQTAETVQAYGLLTTRNEEFEALRTQFEEQTAETVQAYGLLTTRNEEFEALRMQFEEQTAETVQAYGLLTTRNEEFEALRTQLAHRTEEAVAAYALLSKQNADIARLRQDLDVRLTDATAAYAMLAEKTRQLLAVRRSLQGNDG